MSVPLLILAAVLATSTERLTPAETPRSATVDGCVVTGKEAGRKADLREKTGLDEHFVLVGAKLVKGKGPQAATRTPGSMPGPGAMFKISGLTDEQVKIHVGHRVRIEGAFCALERPDAPADVAPQDNLIELNVATIRQVPGDCAAPKS